MRSLETTTVSKQPRHKACTIPFTPSLKRYCDLTLTAGALKLLGTLTDAAGRAEAGAAAILAGDECLTGDVREGCCGPWDGCCGPWGRGAGDGEGSSRGGGGGNDSI